MGTAGVMRALGALVLTIAMLTQTEAAGLKIQRFDPQERKIVGALADNRRVILARATYATYNSGSNIVVMDFVFPSFSFEPGDMISVEAMGTQTNNTGAVAGVGVLARIRQGSNVQDVGSLSAAPSNANPFAWYTKILLGVNQPGANGQYIPPLQPSVSSASQVYPRGLGVSNGIGFAGGGYTLVSDTVYTTASFAGGLLLNSVPATSGSAGVASRSQLVYDNSQPIEVSVVINAAAANDVVTIQAGVMEGL